MNMNNLQCFNPDFVELLLSSQDREHTTGNIGSNSRNSSIPNSPGYPVNNNNSEYNLLSPWIVGPLSKEREDFTMANYLSEYTGLRDYPRISEVNGPMNDFNDIFSPNSTSSYTSDYPLNTSSSSLKPYRPIDSNLTSSQSQLIEISSLSPNQSSYASGNYVSQRSLPQSPGSMSSSTPSPKSHQTAERSPPVNHNQTTTPVAPKVDNVYSLSLGAVKEPRANKEHKKLGWDLFIDAEASNQVVKGTIRKPSNYDRLRDSFNRAKNNAKSQGLAIINFLETSPEILYLEVKQNAKLPLQVKTSKKNGGTDILELIRGIDLCQFSPVEAPILGSDNINRGFQPFGEADTVGFVSKLDWTSPQQGQFRVKVPNSIGFWKLTLLRTKTDLHEPVTLLSCYVKVLSRNTVYKVEQGASKSSTSLSNSNQSNSSSTSTSTSTTSLKSSQNNKRQLITTSGVPGVSKIVPPTKLRKLNDGDKSIVPLLDYAPNGFQTLQINDIFKRLLVAQELGQQQNNLVAGLSATMEVRETPADKPYMHIALGGFHFHSGALFNALKQFDKALPVLQHKASSLSSLDSSGEKLAYVQCLQSNIYLFKGICFHSIARDPSIYRMDHTGKLIDEMKENALKEIEKAANLYDTSVGSLSFRNTGDIQLFHLALLEQQITFKSNLGVIYAQLGHSLESQEAISQACIAAVQFKDLWARVDEAKKLDLVKLFDGLHTDETSKLPALSGTKVRVKELASRGVWMNSASTREIWFNVFNQNLRMDEKESALNELSTLIGYGIQEARRLYPDTHRCSALCEIYRLFYAALGENGSTPQWREQLKAVEEVIQNWHANSYTFEVYQMEKIKKTLEKLFLCNDPFEKQELLESKKERLYQTVFPRRYRMVSPFDLLHAKLQEELFEEES